MCSRCVVSQISCGSAKVDKIHIISEPTLKSSQFYKGAMPVVIAAKTENKLNSTKIYKVNSPIFRFSKKKKYS